MPQHESELQASHQQVTVLSAEDLQSAETSPAAHDIDEDPALPHQDHGYAWVIVFACFCQCMIGAGTYKTFGIIHVELVELFGQGEFKTSLVVVIYSVFSSVGSPVTGWLVNRYPIRNVVLVGSVTSVGGFAMCSFAPTLEYVIVGYGLIVGLSMACFDSPVLAALALYFKKKMSFANGLAYCGASFGALVLPLMFRWWIDLYTVRGCLLLLGGMWLNMAVVGMLIRPVPDYKKKYVEPIVDGIMHTEARLGHMSALKNEKISKASWSYGNKGFVAEETGPTLKTYKKAGVSVVDSQHGNKVAPVTSNDHSALDLLRNTRFMILQFSVFCGGFGAITALFILPSLQLEWGADKFFASVTVTIVGITEIIVRIGATSGIDYFKLDKLHVISVNYLVTAILGICVSFTYNTYAMLVFGCVNGAFGTLFIAVMGAAAADYIPREVMGSAMGITWCMTGIGSTLGYLISGYMRDVMGSYVPVMQILCAAFAVGSIPGLYLLVTDTYKKLRRS